jgi:hypothetical protein
MCVIFHITQAVVFTQYVFVPWSFVGIQAERTYKPFSSKLFITAHIFSLNLMTPFPDSRLQLSLSIYAANDTFKSFYLGKLFEKS